MKSHSIIMQLRYNQDVYEGGRESLLYSGYSRHAEIRELAEILANLIIKGEKNDTTIFSVK